MWRVYCVNRIYEKNIFYLQLLFLKAIFLVYFFFTAFISRYNFSYFTIFICVRIRICGRGNNFGKLYYISQKFGQKPINLQITNIILSHSWRIYFGTFVWTTASKLCHSFPFYPWYLFYSLREYLQGGWSECAFCCPFRSEWRIVC